MYEQTLILVKPDAVADCRTGEILRTAENIGGGSRIRIGNLRMLHPCDILTVARVALWCEFYREHEGKPFFDAMIAFMVCDPVVAAVLRGDDAIARWRHELGATDPRKADPLTIRGRFGDKTGPMFRDAAHGSDSTEAAEREIALVFGESR